MSMASYRLPRHLPLVFDRSRCVACHRPLTFFDLIPILGYLISALKCPICNAKISSRYVLIELFSGVMFLALGYLFGFSLEALIFAVFFILCLVLFVSDLETYLLPIGPMIGIGVLAILRVFLIEPSVDAGYAMILGGLLGAGFFMVLYIITKRLYNQEAIGMGDTVLSGVLGLFLGLKLTAVFLYLSFILGGILGLGILMFRLKNRKDVIPFGPVLLVAAWLALFFGEKLWQYFVII